MQFFAAIAGRLTADWITRLFRKGYCQHCGTKLVDFSPAQRQFIAKKCPEPPNGGCGRIAK